MSGLIDNLCERYSGDFRQMATALDQALAEIDRLRLENANLRSELRELRRRLQDHELRMLRRAERDALLLGALHICGGFTSKREARSIGLGENRWCLARVVLKRGGALRNDGTWRELSADSIESAVRVGVEKIASAGIDALKSASYRHSHPRRKTGALSGASSGAPFVSNARQYTSGRGAS